MAPTTLSTAASAFGLSKNEIEKKIPVVTTLPGTYTIERMERKRILKVVSVRKALALALEKQNKTQRGGETPTNLDKKASDLIRHYNDPIRFMVLTPIPYLNTRDHRTESGVWYRGCELVWDRSSSRKWSSDCYKRVLDTAYLEEEYLRHFEECEAAKELWGLFVREGKGLEHLHRGRHREWASRNVEKASPYIMSFCCEAKVTLDDLELFVQEICRYGREAARSCLLFHHLCHVMSCHLSPYLLLDLLLPNHNSDRSSLNHHFPSR